MKKKRLLMILPIFLVIILAFTATSTIAYAGENNYKVVFPNEQNYVALTCPTSIASNNNNLAILDNIDDKHLVYIKGSLSSSIVIPNTNIEKLQVSNELVAFISNSSINLYAIKTNSNLTDNFTKFLNSEKINNTTVNNSMINNFYLTDTTLYFVKPFNEAYTIFSVKYDENFNFGDLTTIYSSTTDRFENENLIVTTDNIYYTDNQKHLIKLAIKPIENTNEHKRTTLFTFEKNNIAFDLTNAIDYDDNSFNIYTINGDKLTTDDISFDIDLKLSKAIDIKINNGIVAILTKDLVAIYDINDLINKKYTNLLNFGKGGNFNDKLNSPLVTRYYQGNTYVLDSKYNKIKCINDTSVYDLYLSPLDSTILDFVINDDNIYYHTSDKMYIMDLSLKSYSKVDVTITKLRPYKDTIIALIDNKIQKFNLQNNTFEELFAVNSNVNNFSINKNGEFVYLYNGDNIEKYLLNGQKISHSIVLSASNIAVPIIDYEIDNNGNVFAMYKDTDLSIAYFENTDNGYKNALASNNTIVTITTVGKYYPIIDAVDLEIADNKLIITDKISNMIFELNDTNFNYVDNSSYTTTNLANSPLKNDMTVVKPTEDILLYQYENNLEIAKLISKDTLLWVFNEDNTKYPNKNEKMVLCGDEIGYIYSTKLTNVSTNINEFNAKAFVNNFHLYMYPSVSEQSLLLTLKKDTKLKVLSYVEGFSNGINYTWYKVEYAGKNYYAIQNDVVVDDTPQEVVTLKKMIVKSKQIGKNVEMYEANSNDSKIVTTISDGEVVEVIADEGDYKLVKYGDFVGYIKAENLIESGLTNNQIVAIVVSTITLVVALIIFVSTIIIRNKRKNKI